MNANFTKLISSATAVLAVGGSALAQDQMMAQSTTKTCPAKVSCFEQGYELCRDKYPAAYNAAARIDVQNCWDLFLTGSFLYWYADQEGMDLGYATTFTSSALPAFNDKYTIQKFKFDPGFKVGLGWNFDFDNWIAFFEYTWFHQTTTKESTPPVDSRGGTPIYVMSSWYASGVDATSISSKWRLGIDLGDAVLSRPYYQGRKITISPFGGVRGAWIRQSFRVAETTLPADLAVPRISHNHSHSWAVGPRAGCQAHWLLGWGFRMEGDMSGSVLFTRYSAGHREDTGANATTNWIKYSEYNTIRPMVDMGLGLGWGSYFDRQNYHFDLLATYDFSVLWGQNMMRALVNTYGSASRAWEAPDLHLQGLTLTARFDF